MEQRGDMTRGSEWKHLLLFALPLMGGQFLQQLYNAVDGIIVGNYVGDTALAAVGACAPLTMVFVSLAIGLSNGSAVVIAQYFGGKKTEEMRRAASTSIILLLVVGAVLSVVGVVTARPVLAHALSVGPQYIDYAVDYFSIYAMGLLFQFAYNVFAAILRALGDSRATLYFLLVSSVTNVALDLLFVIGFQWSVAGAAIATVISQGMSAVAAVIYMVRKYELLRFSRAEFRFHPDAAAQTMRMAVPNTLQQIVISCGNLALQRIINDFGMVYGGLMSGTTAAMRLESFILIPIFCFNASMATFTGQNVGAGRFDRVKRGRRAGTLMSLVICVVVAAAAYLARTPLVSLFGVNERGLYYGMLYLTILCPSLPLFSLHMTSGGVLQGAGDMKFVAFSSISSFALRLVFAYVLAYCSPLEFRAVWLSIPAGWVYSTLMSWSRYYSGAWKKKAVFRADPAQTPELEEG